ncbi:uncharacterized protein T069G_10564 [Trichoderma breve]|uniref:Uncharacterized protein n=1 Tax=Trichoderma breve TaxID=2034170 RepID=A0A9W9E536_9HYPO|nr:uncharacterized protein T069G_10564 [Trichoderma breve]KAJ4855006.1 hypothetical protein T069G_10564 [Trichoderma breve]
MDPVFRRTRLTETCIFWIRNTIELRYEALKSSIQEASREGEQASPEGSTSHGTSRGDTSARSDSKTIRMTPWVSQDTAMSEAALGATNAPGSITLYKGMDRSRLTRLYDSNGHLDDGRALSSRPPTDFDGRVSAFCFAVDRDLAIEYAAFTKRRSDGSSRRVEKTRLFLEANEKTSTGPEKVQGSVVDHWKRLSETKSGLCQHGMSYRDYREDGFAAGRNAVQYAFLDDEGEELFEKAELKVFPITTAEFSR